MYCTLLVSTNSLLDDNIQFEDHNKQKKKGKWSVANIRAKAMDNAASIDELPI